MPTARPLHALGDEALLAELRELGGTPDAVLREVELVRWFLPLLRADLELSEAWLDAPLPPLRVPLLAIAGSDDRHAPPALVARWLERAGAEADSRCLPGDHFFLRSRQAELLACLVEVLRARLPGASLPRS